MFKVIYDDLRDFLKNHFLASIIIMIGYFTLSKMLIEDAFSSLNSLIDYQFFYSKHFIVNIFLFSVIASATFLTVLYFEDHRKVDSNLYFKAMREKLPKFVFGGLFASFIIGLIFYISFLLAQLNFDINSNFLSVISSAILILAIILMLKTMILFFPMLYYEKDKSITRVFRVCIKRTSWRIIAYYLFIVIILYWLGFMLHYVLDIINLFRFMGLEIGELIQAYAHVMMMLIQVSIYKRLIKL